MNASVRVADWHDANDQQALRRIRQRVFIDEQSVPAKLEWDGLDAQATHFLVHSEIEAVATARLLVDTEGHGRIGRMAVLRPYRDHGIGSLLLQFVIDHAQQHGCRQLHLHAQLTAMRFYQRAGFTACGEVFDEAGIAHCAMFRNCAK